MAGYLGKISAVVSVNTGDFASKLNRCASEVKSFAAATERSIDTAARDMRRSFGSIYTDVQKLERALQAAQSLKLDFKGFDGKSLGAAANQMRLIASVASQISDPLAAAAKKTESLAMAIRGGIHPAFKATQGSVQELQTAIESGASVGKKKFIEMEAAVRKTAQAIERVAEADTMISRLSGGRNMRSQAPQAYSALSRSGDVEGSVEKIPAGIIANTQGLLARQRAAAANVGIAYAKLEAKRDQGQDTTNAQAALDKRVAKLNQINDLIEQEITLYKKAAAAQEAQATAADRLLRLQQGFARSMSGQIQSVSQLESAYSSVLSRAEKLTAAQRATLASGGFSISAAKVQDVISAGDESQVAGASVAMTSMEAAVGGFEQLNQQAADAKKATDDLNESLARIADSIGTPAEPIDQLRQAVAEARSEVNKMAEGPKKASAQAALRGIAPMVRGAGPLGDAEIQRLTGVAQGIGSQAAGINAAPKVKTATDLFGPAFGTAERRAESLKSKVISLQSEFEKMSGKGQAMYAGALNNLRNDVAGINSSTSKQQIAKIAGDYDRLAAAIKRVNDASSFKKFGEFLDDTGAESYRRQLITVQTQMAAIGVTASGPVATAIDEFGDELSQATTQGKLGLDATRQKMRELTDAIYDAAVAEGKLTKAQADNLRKSAMRQGDVGRMGADKASLALNQAAFAIDDFMSATGGVEMKIRAISNNLTQMAYILGSTRGLWIALGAVIASQAAIAIYKFVTGGKTAEDVTNALNEALKAQKNVVAELAGTYRDLAKSMSMSSSAQRGVEASAAVGAVAKGNYDNRRARLTGVNADVVAERAMSSAIKRAMESSSLTSGAGALVYRNERLKASETRARLAEEAARRTPAGRVEDLGAMRARRAGIVAQMGSNRVAGALEALGIDPTYQEHFKAAAKELESLEATIRATEGVIEGWADGMAEAVVSGSQIAKMRLEAAASLLSAAIEANVPGARAFQNQMDSLASEMAGALNDLASASEQTGERRVIETGAAQARFAAAFDKTADLIANTLQFKIKAAFARPGAKDVLGEISNNPRFSGSRASLIGAAARADVADAQLGIRNSQVAAATAEANRIQAEGRKRVADAEQDLMTAQTQTYAEDDDKAKARIEADIAAAQAAVESQKKAAAAADKAAQEQIGLAAAARDAAQAEADVADQMSKLAAAAARTAMELEQFLTRTRKIGEGAVSTAEQTADMAQRRFTERPTEENRLARDEAERQLIENRQRNEIAQNQLDQKRKQLEMDPVVLKAQDQIAAAREEITRLEAEAAANGTEVDPARIRQMRDVEARAIADRERRMQDMTEGERAVQDELARDAEKKRQMEEARQRGPAARAAERERVRQGREDAMSRRERGVLDATRGAENMAAAAGEFANPAERAAFVQKYFNERKKEILDNGPLKQAENERFNAIASGPSRQELVSSDVSTMEGQRELSRLLRGDDASRDVNYAEMKTQTELLTQIAEGIKAATGVTVDF